VLYIRKFCYYITKLHVWNIAANFSIRWHNKICEEANATKLAPADFRMGQLPSKNLELPAGFIQQHI